MRDTTQHVVLPIVDEKNPKCFLCHEGFADIEALREHQERSHKDYLDFHKDGHEPAPGDVTIF